MKILLVLFLIICVGTANAQNLPAFAPKNFTLRIPAFMPGIMKDSSAELRNDTLIYTFKGQTFGKVYKVISSSASLPLVTPWQTLYALTDAYIHKNKKKVVSLYNDDSKAQVEALLNGPNAGEFFSAVSKAARGLKIVAGVYYLNGFAVYSKDDVYGLHENFMIKEAGQYKLSALDDKAPTGWNIGLYYKFNPGPMTSIKNLIMPDSIGLKDTMSIRVTTSSRGRWVAVYTANAGGPVLALAQDNGVNDFNPEKGRVTIRISGFSFMTSGDYSVYISSFNYPVQRVSSSYIRKENLRSIKVTE